MTLYIGGERRNRPTESSADLKKRLKRNDFFLFSSVRLSQERGVISRTSFGVECFCPRAGEKKAHTCTACCFIVLINTMRCPPRMEWEYVIDGNCTIII
jgi:hypothetical protein